MSDEGSYTNNLRAGEWCSCNVDEDEDERTNFDYEDEQYVETLEFDDDEECGEEDVFSEENGEEIDSKSLLNKRMKKTAIDRLSALPDYILIHILSYLDMQEAAITCVLSKRWQFLWYDMPKLEFRCWWCEEICDFVARVHRSLVIRSGNDLSRFAIDFRYEKAFAKDVNVWIEFILKNKVKDVSLMLNYRADLHMLPQMIYCNSSFTKLTLQGCVMNAQRMIEWKKLARLSLYWVELSQYVLEIMLTGCPVLVFLDLHGCWGFDCVEVRSQNLCELAVRDWTVGNDAPLEILAPYVRDLKICLDPHGRKMQLSDISSLVSAEINFSGTCCDGGDMKVMVYMSELLENLHHVKKLEVREGCFEVISMLVADGWLLPQSIRRYLIVNVLSDKRSIPGIIGLLESSPNLIKLVISGCFDIDESDFRRTTSASCSMKGDLSCDLSHLKMVHVKHFTDPRIGGEPMLTLARNLLKRATILRNMVIFDENDEMDESYAISPDDRIKISQALLSYPRSSQEAVVLFR